MPKNGSIKIAGASMAYGRKIKKSRNINAVANQIPDFNLSIQTNNIIINRIQNKTIKCNHIENPIWLALYDNYYNKFISFDTQEHIEHYQNIFQDIKNFEKFEKILIVFENRDVLEFPHNNTLNTNM